ncbi:acyltransferase [Algoriphagus jejuensis]|uniref:Acyltransferase n=1 Tax=Algoriphagus jejuensis TaxID=419934 RepID=A0ABP3YHD3_9BACT
MNRRESLKDPDDLEFFDRIQKLHLSLDQEFLNQFQRSLPLNEVLIDRWERASRLGFGDQTSIYDSSLVLGNVQVGKSCWIGPFTVLDGSGGLSIGDHCTISAGVHIYSHDNVIQTLSSGRFPIDRNPTTIGRNVYIAPNVVIAKGVNIGDCCVVGVGSFVNKSFDSNKILVGQPAKCIGEVIVTDSSIDFKYF